MRKLILIIALTMVPLGIWTAGCRNDQQAAFPDTPEMKSLAGPSDEAVSEVATAPTIPAKPIDREILHYPDNGTLARVQAVRDRANRYASETAGHGLFTLPEEDNYMASAPAARNSGADAENNADVMIPAPSAREFWSRPVAERNSDSNRARRGLPDDVSAMAGPARGDDAMMIPPPPTRAPARVSRDELILPPDDLPGVFMVGGADDPLDAPPPARGWFGMLRNDGGDALGAPPLSSRAGGSAAGARPVAEVIQRRPMLLDVRKLVGMDAGATASAAPKRELAEQRFAASSPEAFPPIAPGARIVSSEGMDFEPLPEPIPLAQYNTMVMDELAAGVPGVSRVSRREGRKPASAPSLPSVPAAKKAKSAAPVLPLPAALLRGTGEPTPKKAPAALLRGTGETAPKAPAPRTASRKTAKSAPVAAPAIPELTETKSAAKIPGADQFAKVEKALAPLPVLAAPAAPALAPSPVPAKPRQKKVVVAMPPPVPEPAATPASAAAKSALLEFSPEAMDEAFAELNQNDGYKADFWDPAAKTQRMAEKSALPALPELSEPEAPGELMIPMPPPLLEEPKKIVLQPIRKSGGGSEMEAIDSATDAPPLKF